MNYVTAPFVVQNHTDQGFSRDFDALQALESQRQTQLRALEAGVAALQRQVPSSAGGTGVSPEAVEKLASIPHAMQRSLEQMQSSGGKHGNYLPANCLHGDCLHGYFFHGDHFGGNCLHGNYLPSNCLYGD